MAAMSVTTVKPAGRSSASRLRGLSPARSAAAAGATNRASTWLLRRRNQRNRRAMRAIALSTCSSLQRHRMAEQRRQQAVAAAQNFATMARLAATRMHTQAFRASSPTSTAAPPTIEAAATDAAVGTPTAGSCVARSDKGMPPETYLLRLLEKRGRQPRQVSSVELGYHKAPTEKQIRDYVSKPFITDLVRKGDIDGLRQAVKDGRGMDASNKFGETVVHVACRRGNMDVLRFVLDNGGSLTGCDDLGRFPLHEVCWAVEPRFDVVRLFLEDERESSGQASTQSDSGPGRDHAVHLLLVKDKRGCSPLRYVKEDSWPQWRLFLDDIVDEYWPAHA